MRTPTERRNSIHMRIAGAAFSAGFSSAPACLRGGPTARFAVGAGTRTFHSLKDRRESISAAVASWFATHCWMPPNGNDSVSNGFSTATTARRAWCVAALRPADTLSAKSICWPMSTGLRSGRRRSRLNRVSIHRRRPGAKRQLALLGCPNGPRLCCSSGGRGGSGRNCAGGWVFEDFPAGGNAWLAEVFFEDVERA